MGLIAFPLADIVSLLLFDTSHHHYQTDHHRLAVLAQPSSSIVVPNNDIGITAPQLYQHNDGVISDEYAAMSPPRRTGSSKNLWNLPNGKVQFDRPLSFAGITIQDGELKSDSSPSASISLWDPTLLGSGGSGAVFSLSTHPNHSPSDYSNLNKQPQDATSTSKANDHDNNVAIKVSWKRSRDSVENECNILQSLEHVPHVERCLGRPNPYPYEDGRVMIAVTPVMTTSTATSSDDGLTSSLANVKPGQPQINAVRSVVETIVGMLNCGIYTLDVQPLISVETGEVLFIDFTEAKHFSTPLTPLDESGLVDFCGEGIALIPDSLKDVAGDYLMAELSGADGNTAPLPERVVEILESMWIG